ncbi:TetR/AcrR family transcriptional regulator [Erythrobacter sp. BLCC-B19]|uniref:TetR/AcrR family transcriptional regulator n=1 Tax=Erythrobacter sp. BLCC-B19 TaxID=3025315 RepID=UPI0023613CBB|nr:TetR/AcrR family transcriptional regulator [Erythrobacter sp. BLCC-B19]WDA39631.1 TetR/AcrR family transcriptional regulator [Erythrobacter sp. BLCC-B19]
MSNDQPATATGAPKSGKRRARVDHAERRAAILRTGAALFVERGLRGGTMDEIALRMGISKVVIYREFASKDALIAAIFEDVLEALGALKNEPWSGYAGGTIGTIAAARQQPDAFLLLYRDCRSDPLYRHHFERLQALYVDWLMGYFEHERGTGSHRALRAEMAVLNLTGFLFEALANWLTTGTPDEDTIFASWIGDMIRDWRWNTEQKWQIPRRRA